MKKIIISRGLAIILGLLLFLIFLEILLRIGGIVFTHSKTSPQPSHAESDSVYTILCLGESTTDGQWPPLLETYLNHSECGVTFDVIDEGARCTNTAVIVSRLPDFLDEHNPDMVITMMGINDAWDTVAYAENQKTAFVLFMRGFRVYKLAKLLGQHLHVFYVRIIQRWESLCYAYAQEEGGMHDEQKNYNDIFSLAHAYYNVHDHERARDLLLSLKNDHPEVHSRLLLARCHHRLGELRKAIEVCAAIIETDAECVDAYIELSVYFRELGKRDKAIHYLKIARDINANNGAIYEQLGLCYSDMTDRANDAIEMYERAIALNPDSYVLKFLLSLCHRHNKQDKFKMYSHHRYLNTAERYKRVGLLLAHSKDAVQGETILKEGIVQFPNDPDLHSALGLYYLMRDHYGKARTFFSQAERLRMRYYPIVTAHNYNFLRKSVLDRGIKLVCVQYPMRPVKPLKKMLSFDSHITFVDNEDTFKKAVRQNGFNTYFWDYFGYDFGHCTDAGNELLAENIARTIIEEKVISSLE